MDLKINPKYEAIIPPLDSDEYVSLSESIKENGQYEKIKVNRDLVILDGHHRYKICKELGIAPEYEIKHFENVIDEEIYVIESNVIRRHIPVYVKVELAKPLEKLYAERAKQRKLNGTLLPNGSKVETAEKLAKLVGTSTRTYYRAKAIRERGTEDMCNEARSKGRMINKVYNKLIIWEKQREIKETGSPPLPDGVFDVLYVDPPWRYDYGGSIRGKADIHYPTMYTKDICLLPIREKIADEAILFLWATNPFLEDAIRVASEWGFDYKTCMVWVKPHIGTGFYVRSKHELLLICRKGTIPHPADEDRPPSVIEAPKTQHSAKPPIVYDLIEQMYPNRKYLELFARNSHPGWASWGNEVGS